MRFSAGPFASTLTRSVQCRFGAHSPMHHICMRPRPDRSLQPSTAPANVDSVRPHPCTISACALGRTVRFNPQPLRPMSIGCALTHAPYLHAPSAGPFGRWSLASASPTFCNRNGRLPNCSSGAHTPLLRLLSPTEMGDFLTVRPVLTRLCFGYFLQPKWATS